MTKKENTLRQSNALRQLAEKAFRKKADTMEINVESLTPEETRQLIHELQVHQIELEMQNDNLRRAHEELDASRSRYLELFDLAPVGYCSIDENGLILEANLTFATMLGIPRGILVKQSISRFISPEDQDTFYRHQMLLFKTDVPQLCEARMLSQDGKTFWARMESIVTRDTEGASVSRTAISDITGRKQAEEELAENAAKLVEINKDLKDFNDSVSNDLRVPLRAIAGYSRIILKKAGEKLDGETQRLFQTIIENIQKMERLINELTAFSHIGRQVVAKQNVNMEEIVRDVWQQQLALNHGREMSLTIGKIPAVLGDWSMMRQVYINLLENAVKFTLKRKPAVIEAGSMDGGEGTIYYVRDNGIGFDMKFHDKIFGLFKRLHYEEEYDGTGVGLALVERIVKRHGGRVWAESKPNKGATFYFMLPKKEISPIPE
ncbi:MAG: Adaptive-response sensory-kinase SasA [Syntrophus sp. SKADARSKE-3]|nr:Adaptive-response sensory-kinase SasA [Syntrophus sp. SKADARSKE-3]